MSWGRNDWAPYVPVSQKLGKATRLAAQRAKKEKRDVSPVTLKGRTIATTFWGKAWCDNLTAYQDFSNRLPRGATYVRNGSVVDLLISPKKIEAIVAGSEPYSVRIDITALDSKRWKALRSACSQSIDSLLDLLTGKLSDGVMQRLTDQKTGLFPSPQEIRVSCSCPDYSSCCKHLAAVMYGVGARLDSTPELLFLLRGVDHQELVSQAMAAGNLNRELAAPDDGQLGTQDLSELFGIELETIPPTASAAGEETSETGPVAPVRKKSRRAVAPAARTTKTRRKKTSAKKATVELNIGELLMPVRKKRAAPKKRRPEKARADEVAPAKTSRSVPASTKAKARATAQAIATGKPGGGSPSAAAKTKRRT